MPSMPDGSTSNLRNEVGSSSPATRTRRGVEDRIEQVFHGPAEQIFLGWDTPILAATVDRLFAQYSDPSQATWELRDQIVVLPSSLAKRRLTELLALRAEQAGMVLYPPEIVTVGSLPERLYIAKFPFASQLVQHLAWMQALQETPVGELQDLVPAPPPKSMPLQWLELAKLLSKLHRELASDRLSFQHVATRLGKGHAEYPRWAVLAAIQTRYLHILDSLELWDIQTARLYALDHAEPQASAQILVVGCVDLNRTQRGFLEAVAEHVQVWIAAPQQAASMFDSYGCLDSQCWMDETLEIEAGQLLVGNSPADQAELTVASVAEWGDSFHRREVTVGVPDVSLIPELQHRFALSGVKARHGAGSSLELSEPVQLMRLIGKYLEGRSYASFAALIRHPAISNLLKVLKAPVGDDWLLDIDDYYRATLPKQIDGFVNEDAPGAGTFKTVTKAIDRWLSKLGRTPHRLSSLVPPLLAALGTAYERIECRLDDPQQGRWYAAAAATCAAIVELREVPDGLQPRLTASELMDWLANGLQGQLVPEPPDMTSVEMLGWLELAFDDAPALVVAGIHDGVVPESVNADAFLPNQLRRQLGMLDNDRRYARDVYTMRVLLHSREQVRFVVGKTDASGDPLIPSRLLLACSLDRLPARVMHLVQEQAVDVLPPVAKQRWQPVPGASRLSIPRPDQWRTPAQLNVTSFRDFLRCPYRYYLRHVLKLQPVDDATAEMGAPQFGVLIHDTLAELSGPIGKSADVEEVRSFLQETLRERALSLFGEHPAAAVLIQIEQAEQRLSAFAEAQAERAAQGWEIRWVEQGTTRQDQLLIGGETTLPLVGRIDRIDYHPATGRWAIWDYKTSENAKRPLAVHWTEAGGWQDLQLPLYRPIARHLGVEGEPSLGYIALPRQAAESGFHVADFSPAQLAEADRLAAKIVSQIVRHEFWQEQLETLPFDDFERICQTHTQQVSAAPPVRRQHRHLEQHNARPTKQLVQQAEHLVQNPVLTQPELPPLLIRASAGTGKTFQLSNRLLQILLAGHNVDSILATTFTRKAAGEILHRVLERLARACCNEQERQTLAEHLPGVDSSPANCLASLRRVTRSIHRLRIGTLDSFFAQVARAFSLELALPQGWQAMDPVQEPQLQLQSIGRMLDGHDRQTLVNLVRMLAKGESSRRVADEIQRTVSAGYAAFRITQAEAWDQLPLPAAPSEAALASALSVLESARLQHKSADKQLARLHLEASTGNWEAVVAHGIYRQLEETTPSYYRKELPEDLIAALQVIADRAAAELLPIRRNQTLASYHVLTAYDEQYLRLVKQLRLLAFADITHCLAEWMAPSKPLKSPPPTSSTWSQAARHRLEFRLDCGIQHLLLDEFQDTAPEQWRILEPLAKPLAERGAADRSVFCVGDTKQAIYGWRGGVAEVFEAVAHALPAIEQQELRQSFRSSPEVMGAVNDLFSNLPRHSNFADCDSVARHWSETFPEHQTARNELVGYVCLQNGPAKDSQLPLEEHRLALLRHSAQQIQELTDKSSASIGVLLRTNQEVGRMIGILRDMGVSASQDGGNPLTDSAAVELLLSLVHLADHPGDSVCLYHVATSPLAAILPGMREASQPPQAVDATQVALWFRQQVARRGLGHTVEDVAETLADQLSWWDQHRLQQLIRLAHQMEGSLGGRLSAFEQAVERQRVALPTEAQVKVMTIHKSKGLEFDALFLPDLEIDLHDGNALLVMRGDDPCQAPTGVLRYMNASLQTLLPADWQAAFQAHKERSVREALCLLYVAVTRARRALYLTSTPTSRSGLQNFSSILQSVLGHGENRQAAASILYERGDCEWYQAIPTDSEQASDSKQTPRQPSLQIALRDDLASAPPRGLRVAAPSYVSHQLEPVPLKQAFSYSHSRGATYGTIIHAFFEQVRWLEDQRLDRQSLRRIALAAVSPEELQAISLDQVILDFEELLQLSSVRTALSRSRYQQTCLGQIADRVEIDNERAISLIMDGQLVSGTIDRLAVLYHQGKPYAAEIIDYKTDAFDPAMTLLWLEDRIAQHRPQLEVYARVVSKLLGLPRTQIATHLVMLSTDDFVTLDATQPLGQGPHLQWSSSPASNSIPS